MWAILSHPGHAESFLDHGEAYAPMRRLVERLGQRPYAGEVYAVKSMWYFCLTTAPSYQEAPGHDEVWIAYNPGNGLFDVGYDEWISPTRNPQRRTAVGRTCERPEVMDVVDRYVLRLLLLGRERDRPR
jgi:hypothetical protein